MRKAVLYAALGSVLCVLAPTAGRAVYCSYADNTVCLLYDVCRQILDKYPESEIPERGKDCALTAGNRQLIIRRKRAAGRAGYFVLTKILPLQKAVATNMKTKGRFAQARQ